jgi:hypothetical protein
MKQIVILFRSKESKMVVITLRIEGGKTFEGLSPEEADSLAIQKRKEGYNVWVMTDKQYKEQNELANQIIDELIAEEKLGKWYE